MWIGGRRVPLLLASRRKGGDVPPARRRARGAGSGQRGGGRRGCLAAKEGGRSLSSGGGGGAAGCGVGRVSDAGRGRVLFIGGRRAPRGRERDFSMRSLSRREEEEEEDGEGGERAPGAGAEGERGGGAGVKRSEGGARAETVVAVRGARRNVAVRKVFFSRAGRAPEREERVENWLGWAAPARVAAAGPHGLERVRRRAMRLGSRARAGERAGPSCLSRSQNSCRVNLTWRAGSARARPDSGTVGQRPGGGQPRGSNPSAARTRARVCVVSRQASRPLGPVGTGAA